MKVRMIWQMSGTRGDGQDWCDPGSEMDLPDHEARSLIERGAAVPVKAERPVETADAPVDPAVEKRVSAPPAYAGGYVPNNPEPEPEPEAKAEPEPEPEQPVKRGPGRPPGSKNQPK